MTAPEADAWTGRRLGPREACTTTMGAWKRAWGGISVDGNGTTNTPRIVNVTLASSLGAYLLRTQELGAVEGPEGSLALHPALQPVLEALHHVLAGGEIAVHVLRSGNPDIVAELDRRAAYATREANILNKVSGSALTTTV